MSNTQNTPKAAAAAALASLVGNTSPQRLFTPRTYLKKNGDVGADVKPLGAWNGITVESALLILQNPDDFAAAAMEAAKQAKAPGEKERLAAEKAAKAQAKASKAAPAATPTNNARAAELAAELAALQGA